MFGEARKEKELFLKLLCFVCLINYDFGTEIPGFLSRDLCLGPKSLLIASPSPTINYFLIARHKFSYKVLRACIINCWSSYFFSIFHRFNSSKKKTCGEKIHSYKCGTRERARKSKFIDSAWEVSSADDDYGGSVGVKNSEKRTNCYEWILNGDLWACCVNGNWAYLSFDRFRGDFVKSISWPFPRDFNTEKLPRFPCRINVMTPKHWRSPKCFNFRIYPALRHLFEFCVA